jgi:hypothetical protein
MVSLNCPQCDSEFSPAPSEGSSTLPLDTYAVSVCLHCGFLGVWSGQGWDAPDPQTRARLLRSPAIVDALAFSRELAEQRARDHVALHATIEATLTYLAQHNVHASAVPGALVEAILDEGFHRHLSDDDDDDDV